MCRFAGTSRVGKPGFEPATFSPPAAEIGFLASREAGAWPSGPRAMPAPDRAGGTTSFRLRDLLLTTGVTWLAYAPVLWAAGRGRSLEEASR